MTSLKDMEVSLKFSFCSGCSFIIEQIPWPSASRAWDLLNGVKLSDGIFATQLPKVLGKCFDGQKQVAVDAFEEKDFNYSQQEPCNSNVSGQSIGGHNGVQDFNTQIMAEMLGLDIPGMDPSVYRPGYQLWPSTSGHKSSTPLVSQSISPLQIPTQMDYSDSGSQVDAQGRLKNWAYPMSFSSVPESYRQFRS